MTYQEIKTQSEAKLAELIEKYFGNLVAEAAVEQPENIGEYSLELPKQIEKEYSEYLKSLWQKIAPAGSPTFEEIIDKKADSDRITEKDRVMLKSAHDDATKRTFWERLTQTNHEDVTYYKGLLKRYTKDLLTALQCDFIEDVKMWL